MPGHEFENIPLIEVGKAKEMYPAVSTWLDLSSRERPHMPRHGYVTAQVSEDGTVRFPSAQQRILRAGGVDRVGRTFQNDLLRGDYGPFTLYMAAEPTTTMDVYAGVLMVEGGLPRHPIEMLYHTKDLLTEAGLVKPAGDIVVLSRNSQDPGTVAVFQDSGIQTTPAGFSRLREIGVLPKERAPRRSRRGPGRHQQRGQHP